ncbi:MAG: hypothetical protein FJZ63_04010 [Chlamydiae bacterium]|nr:hypothetical protein [Chlamydiota bacterium]
MKLLGTLLGLLITATSFADNFILENETPYPNKDLKSKMAVQWATSAAGMHKCDEPFIEGSRLDKSTWVMVKKQGQVNVALPKGAQYFRILVWSHDVLVPDLHTNWVQMVPDKVYTLKKDQLSPTVLMGGFGC